jgi:hypothetical protein
MGSEKRPRDLIRASRVLLENPYAYIEDLEDWVDAPDVFRAEPVVFAPKPTAAREAHIVPRNEALTQSIPYLSGNPYASLASGDEEEDRPAEKPRSLREEISKADFRSECTRIFMPYIPPHLPRRMLQHHRDFIARNERRSPNERYRVLAGLKRYDLSSTPGITPQFNRELRGELSEEKLRRIEVDAGVA